MINDRAQGSKVAVSECVHSEAKELVRIVKDYPLPEIQRKPDQNDKLRQISIDLSLLRDEIKHLKSRCARLENEIQSEVKMLTGALNDSQETREQVKRRISRLKGSLEYKGHG